MIWEADIPWADRLDLFFTIYDDMPCYAHLMYAQSRYLDFGPSDRERWWSEVRVRLGSPDLALKQPIQYALWCDFFEDSKTVDEAWAELTRPDASHAILKAVLPMSGPVPYALKAPVYERLLSDSNWHGAIFESLLRSAFDVQGKIDKRAARHVLSKLTLPAGHAHVAELRTRLRWWCIV
jgi:hypothetical protein